ncbi:peptide ABC transporter substrate-binding protein [Nibricoccus sp. IMCC34717]|uniref:peptide ABC transporter substrate-binding protein n=1 Tax=Nibricoccus sp. IMCC34717 TaxID=3034021 RepID=UPI00384C6979
MRRFLRRVAVLACLLGLTQALRAGTPAEDALKSRTLLLGNGSEPQDLDPQTVLGFNEYNIMIALFEGLTVLDEATSRPIPGTAEAWTISEDGLRYVFTLRAGAKWSNGDPVTAQDFVESYQRMLTPKLAADYAYMLYPIRGAEEFNTGKTTDFATVGLRAVDARTLEIVLTRPTPHFLDLCAHQTYFPVHTTSLAKFGAVDERGTRWTQPGNLVGNGAFVLTEWLPNSRLVVKRNAHYWGNAANRLEAVVFYPNEDIAADERNFRAGQVHVTYDLLPNKIPAWKKSAPQNLRIDPFLESYFLRFNVTRAPFDNKKVRQALARAIDRETICNVLLFGSRTPAAFFTPPNTAGYTSRATVPTSFDEARRLLAEAGFPGGKGLPVLEIQMNHDAINQRVYEAVQELWRRELGVTVRLVRADFRVYLDAMKSLNFHASRARWVGDFNDPVTYLDMFVSGGGNNWTGWANPEYDRLIRTAAETLDTKARLELFQQAEALLLEEAPIAPIFFGAKTYLIHTAVKGWVPSLLGIHRYQTVWLED